MSRGEKDGGSQRCCWLPSSLSILLYDFGSERGLDGGVECFDID